MRVSEKEGEREVKRERIEERERQRGGGEKVCVKETERDGEGNR